MKPINWTPDHYKALLLLHASHVDLEYSIHERSFIEGQVGAVIAREVESFFHNQSDYENLNFLVSQREKYMPGPSGREEALVLIDKLFKVDGDYSRLERNSYKFLEKMFYQDGDTGIDLYNG